jgi:hypothetical protein
VCKHLDCLGAPTAGRGPATLSCITVIGLRTQEGCVCQGAPLLDSQASSHSSSRPARELIMHHIN